MTVELMNRAPRVTAEPAIEHLNAVKVVKLVTPVRQSTVRVRPPVRPVASSLAINADEPHIETLYEEIASAVTHGLGALFSIAALVSMVCIAAQQGDPWRVTSCAIFGSMMVVLYLASTVYHAWPWLDNVKQWLQRFDHASIYLLIAGSYTPWLLVSIRGAWGWALFGVIWGSALVGILFKLFFGARGALISTIMYILMGWMAVIAILPIAHVAGWGAIGWLFIGGLCYTGGVVFFLRDNMPYNHALWHLFVLAGTAAHCYAVMQYVLPLTR